MLVSACWYLLMAAHGRSDRRVACMRPVETGVKRAKLNHVALNHVAQGLVALEACTQLQELSLHPVSGATSAGLIALCDYCDSLESLLLAHCPRVSEHVILQVWCACVSGILACVRTALVLAVSCVLGLRVPMSCCVPQGVMR
jgi:hypothetical protein